MGEQSQEEITLRRQTSLIQKHQRIGNINTVNKRRRGFSDELRGHQLVEKILSFMEAEDSLPQSQAPATCSYPEPD
jgi:hypothetical protein